MAIEIIVTARGIRMALTVCTLIDTRIHEPRAWHCFDTDNV